GGHLQANVQARSRPDGNWTANGTINGSEIRVLRVDEGMRLLDGELEAYFDNDRLVLERLYFPARLRVKPKEWRTNEWVTSNPDAQDGYLTLSGSWNLATMEGDSQIEFYRYPLMQRTDRYAMVSGKIAVDVPFPHVSVAGELTVDAGWVDLDMLSSVPTLDSDVVVLRPGDEEEPEAESPVDISVNLTVDLGPRFYITGFGLDSGLVGQLTIQMVDGDLRGIGILRTRGGAIEAYGQRLQLRQGSITFQGDLTNPVLHIEALRTGLQVEAGVAVLGTARKPRIDLISYPDVSEAQKLSWLLLGRGPEDSGGGDAMLLLSVGTALLSEGEPFYRKFGIDELSLQTGELGSTGSILPPESVVSGLSAGASSIEQQFVVASKALGRGFVLSIEQALSDTGTVGRASYRLMRGLTAELSVGTVNGLALIYRRFFGR
ncbi:MAG TPA: translocation/assembly module TamB domain-containing protein, partial [Burkholderiaceae bacterium]|nr:translocation/assembly module TamB domain-containing protein [Burkholderiaceae bacterium]